LTRAVGVALFVFLQLGLGVLVGRAETQLEVLNTDAVVNATAKGNSLYLRSKGGAVKSLQISLLQLKSDDGTPLALDTITFVLDPARTIASDAVSEIPLRIDAQRIPRAGTYTGLAQVNALDAAGVAVKGIPWSFKCLRQPVEAKFGDTDGVHMLLSRPLPFRSIQASIPVPYKLTPSQSTPDISFDVGALSRTVGANKYLIPNASVTAQSDAARPGTVKVTTTLPSFVKDATGTLRAKSVDFKADVDTPVVVAVKDYALWPLLVVFLGQYLSFKISRWVSKDRQALLNGVTWQQIGDDLDTVITIRPDLASHPNRAVVVELLRRARRQGETGDTDTARTTLAAAQSKLDELRAIPLPPPPQLQAAPPPPTPHVEILDAPAARVQDRLIQFLISDPSPTWLPTDLVQWSYVRDGRPPVPLPTTRERHTVAAFQTPGAYTVTAVVQNQNVAPATFQILPAPTSSIVSRIASVDSAINVLAVLVAAALSYIAMDKLESFGTPSDYILAFAGGFGINETLKGFGPVLAKLRGS